MSSASETPPTPGKPGLLQSRSVPLSATVLRQAGSGVHRRIDQRFVARIVRTAALLLAVSHIAPFGANVFAAEQAEAFVNGLNERGLGELALDYLERMQTSPLADDAFRRRIPYHRGVVLLEQSRLTVDPAVRDKLLAQAEHELTQFAGDNSGSIVGAESQMQLGYMQLERGQQLVAQANKLPQDSAYEAERRKLAGNARPQFAAARATFEGAASVISAELEKLPPATADDAAAEAGSRRQEYRARVAQLRFLAAQTAFEVAQTYTLGEEQFLTSHEAAAKELSALFDEFARSPNALIGLYARLYEGRCYQAVAKYPLALGCYEDILAQPNVVPAFRKLIAAAVHRKAEVLITQDKAGESVAMCRLCLQDATAEEQKLPEWLAVKFRLAEALTKQASTLAAGSAEQRRLQAEARSAYRNVAAVPGEFQSDARLAATALARNDSSTANETQTFQVAYDLGKEALASYNVARQALPTAEQNNPSAVVELQEQMRQGKTDARRYFTLATTLVDDDTDAAALNEVRYFLCWLDWEAEDFYRSAVMGEFLVRRYPDHPSARSAAKISMASFERLLRQSADATSGVAADTEFEARRMAQMAEFITRRWPGTEDADAAFGVLVSHAIRSSRIEEAEKLLNVASPEARPRLELQLGTAMWGRYLELAQANGAMSQAATLDALKQSAENYLRSGIAAVQSASDVNEVVATATLYLVQVSLANGQYQEAVEMLEAPETGPLSLVEQEHPAADGAAYVVETYKAALRAYVLATPPQLEKAVKVMTALEAVVRARGNEAADSPQMLTRIYVSLSVALQKQVTVLRDAGRDDDAEQLAAAIVQFLERVSTRQDDIDWPTRNWLAQTYYSLGVGGRAGPTAASIDPKYVAPTKIAGTQRDYVVKARDGYEHMLAAVGKDSKSAPNETAVLAAKLQLSECYRALGQYDDALNLLSAILAEKEASLTVQRVAAYTYQDRGQAEDAKWLERAIHGGYRLRSTGQNRVWGWLKIAQVAVRNAQADEKHRDIFFEARLNVARCRYLAALKSDGATQRQDLAKALQSIQSLAQLYPELGGERWRGEFQELMKRIQSKQAGGRGGI